MTSFGRCGVGGDEGDRARATGRRKGERRSRCRSDARHVRQPRPALHRGVPAVDADHAAAGVRAGAAEEDAGHRRAGLRGGGPTCRSGRHSPWKMWPPVRPTPRSMSGGPSTCTAMTASGMLLQNRPIEARARSARPPRAGCPSRPPRTVCGTYWAKTLIVCDPFGGDAAVVARLEIELGPEPRRQPALAGRPVKAACHSSLVSGVLIWPR